jgi:hypothetical protein
MATSTGTIDVLIMDRKIAVVAKRPFVTTAKTTQQATGSANAMHKLKNLFITFIVTPPYRFKN